MGVRGLTSFIAKNAERYLKPFELHDCDLVIDGDNLSCNLYKDASGCNSAFGGDYDKFYQTVVAFFHLLEECNVTPYVLMDGGYERKKMRTVCQRLRGKISIIKHINPVNSKPIFPLMMREVFVDAAKDCGVNVMRCLFEADDELAALSRKLNCPVLSYDSDFYIHNVQYIPLITVTMKVLTKKKGDSKVGRKLRRCEAKNLQKRHNADKVSREIQVDGAKPSKNSGKPVKYLDCCMYKIENLISGGSISDDMLPLFAALLGNDYIDPRTFRKFYSQIGMRGVSKKIPQHQKKIQAILKWLRHETKESALEKVLGRMKKCERQLLMTQMECATNGYANEYSESFEFFGLEVDEPEDDEDEEEEDECEEEEYESNEEVEEEEECSEEEVDDECTEEDSFEEVEEEDDEEEAKEVNEDPEEPEEDAKTKEFLAEVNSEAENPEETVQNPKDCIPDWVKEKYMAAELPRFVVDLLHLKLYINNPQIEHFMYPDCNQVAIPLLHHIFSLLHYPNEIPEFRYLTRLVRVTNVHYVAMKPDPPAVELKHDAGLQLYEPIFSKLKLDTSELFSEIQKLPRHLQLYVLSLIYCAKKSKHFTSLHLKSILLCAVVMSTIDSKVEPIRDEKLFKKKFSKIIQKERLSRQKDVADKKLEKAKQLQEGLSPAEKIRYISKADCILVQENLLKYFHLQETFKKRYDEFSTVILHGSAEFQSVLFNLMTFNVLVNKPLESPKIAQLYCGMFVYNIYTCLKDRPDPMHYVESFLLRDSPIMYEFYSYLVALCEKFVSLEATVSKRVANKVRKSKEEGAMQAVDPNEDMLERSEEDEDVFSDLNNKFSTLLKVH